MILSYNRLPPNSIGHHDCPCINSDRPADVDSCGKEGGLLKLQILLGGSWDLVSRVIRTLIGAISRYINSYLPYNPTY